MKKENAGIVPGEVMGISWIEAQKEGNGLQTSNHEGIGSTEQERYRIASLRELDLESETDLDAYFKFLTHDDNIEHFGNPPVDVNDLKRKLLRDNTHAYIAEDQEGTIVGAGGINDAAEGEHDHFLVKIVVDPQLQSKGVGQGKDVGRQLAIQLTEKAFYTKASDGRTRFKLDAAIIEGVAGWERMPHILENLGFHFRSRLPGQADVYDPTLQRVVRRPTVRWEIEREEWMRVRRRVDIKDMLQQQSQYLP